MFVVAFYPFCLVWEERSSSRPPCDLAEEVNVHLSCVVGMLYKDQCLGRNSANRVSGIVCIQPIQSKARQYALDHVYLCHRPYG